MDVLCWNVAVGAAELAALLRLLRGGAWGGAGTNPERPLVFLLQEAFRADLSVPERTPERGAHGGNLVPRRTIPEDVVELAHAHRLSLAYAPSMRNGAHRSDRGNAVLATAALAGATEIPLLFLRQRRVAVAAALQGLPHLRWVSVHLDTHRAWFGSEARQRRPGGARAAQAAAIAQQLCDAGTHTTVLAGDFNTPLGLRDPAARATVAAGFQLAPAAAPYHHTWHGPVRLLLDHVFTHDPARALASIVVQRLDEHTPDRGGTVFGSDHHPLLARVSLRSPHTHSPPQEPTCTLCKVPPGG